MEPAGIQHRVSAILMADVVGYSRLMARNVVQTVEKLNSCRRIFSERVTHHGGRVVNTPGDSILAEFPDAITAVECARIIQIELDHCNEDLPSEQRMMFRIGISHGEIVVEDHGIYGQEVNVAARLESMADPGGICISGIAHTTLGEKLHRSSEFLGEHQLKNIDRPVQVYRMLRDGASPRDLTRSGKAIPTASRLNKPSIAVLPFNNMSSEPDQEYFADGITEDIITELSRFKSLLVTARNSTFVYKGKAVSVTQVGRDLGVDYVLEGSVRKVGPRVRITAQLIDSTDGMHLWAERYDRGLEDIFTVQDEIARMIVASLPQRLEAATLKRAKRKPPDNLVAYDYLLRGKDLHFRFDPDANRQALEMLDQAIEKDPDFAQAYAWKACTLGQAMARGFQPQSTSLVNQALELAQKAHDLDKEDSEGHRILCEIYLLMRKFDRSESHHEQAIALNPNDPRILGQRGQLYTWTDRAEEGIYWIELARRLEPYPPDKRADSLGMACFVARHYKEAAKAFRLISNPSSIHLANLAASLAMLGDNPAASDAASQVPDLEQDFSVDAYVKTLLYADGLELQRQHHVDALKKSGLR